MEKYFKRKSILEETSGVKETNTSVTQQCTSDTQLCSKQCRVEINLNLLPSDPGLRNKILDYHPNDRDNVRRAYLQNIGPCRGHNFRQRKIGEALSRFVPAWFDEHGDWLEYSIANDAAFSFYCYLYGTSTIGFQGGGDYFVMEGYTNWKNKNAFNKHVGALNSAHNQAWRKCQDLLNQKQHIQVAYAKQSDQARQDYRICLTATLDYIRFLLRQGLAFRGRDESKDSHNQGNFLELLKFLADHNEPINNVVLKNAPENLKMIVPDIQKDLVHAATIRVTNAIINDLGDGLFAILLDESRDLSIKEQAALLCAILILRDVSLNDFLA